MRFPLLPLLVALAAGCAGRTGSPSPRSGLPSPADSALIGRILLAEDGRNSSDRALAEGVEHPDSAVRVLARRAQARIGDPRFATRDAFPVLATPIVWPEPTWRLRFRALAAQRDDCVTLRSALADSAWPVRLRAADLVAAPCAADAALADRLGQWIDALPNDASRRAPGGVSWHAGAHALVALARARPAEAKPRIATLAAHRQWQVRMYAARAAAIASDTARLRTLVSDTNANVQEAAIEGLAKLTGHADDQAYLSVLHSNDAQAVRAAAIALKGSLHPGMAEIAAPQLERWETRANASERDVRLTLRELLGRPTSEDRAPPVRVELPPRAVALALGGEIRVRVTMAPSSGGGSFVVRLRGDVAPMMAARVLELVRRRYYDGLTWHRVEHDFVIQGGSPGASEYVGYAQFFRDELGTVPHVRGTVGMSTRGHDTGDAQWFVNLKDNLRLGRDYTVFAEVVEGMEVVDGIMEGDVVVRIEEVR